MLTNKVVVITGAASGIGRALALECAKRQAHLALIDIEPDLLAQLKMEIDAYGVVCSVHITDVGQKEAVKKTANDIYGFHRRTDILINNAGIYVASPFESVDLVDFERVMRVNFMGTVHCCKYFLRYLRQSEQAVIANMCSDFGWIGFPNKSSYCAAKAAMIGFSKTLMSELYGTPVRIMLVFPPAVDTGLIRNSKAWDFQKKEKEVRFVQRKGMPVEKVAQRIADGLEHRKNVLKIGLLTKVIDSFARLWPVCIQHWIGRFKSRLEFV